jgi:hypothetical protein
MPAIDRECRSNPAAENPLPQVEAQLQRINNSLGRTHDLIESMEIRLEPIAKPKENEALCQSDKEIQLVPMAERLKSYANQMTTIKDFMESILRRIEI